MMMTTENMRAVASTGAIADRSVIHTDNKQIVWDEDGEVNTVELTHIPNGSLISLTVVTTDGETLVVDGTPSRAGKVVSFLPGDNLHTCQSEIRYLIG